MFNFFSCKKTGTETTKEQTVKEGYSQNGSHQQNVLRYNRPTDAVKIFLKQLMYLRVKELANPQIIHLRLVEGHAIIHSLVL